MENWNIFNSVPLNWQEYNFNSLIKELSSELEFKNISGNLNNKSDYLKLAKKLFKYNRFSESITICKKCISENPDSGEAFVILARCFWEYEDKQSANLLLACAILCWENLAKKMAEEYRAYIRIPTPDITALTPTKSKLLHGDGSHADKFYDTGVFLHDKEEYENASIFYKLAILNNNKLWKAYANLGSSIFNSGNFFEAIPIIFSGLEINPNDDKMLSHLGVLFYITGYNVFSNICLKQAIKINSENDLAKTFYKDYDDAEKFVQFKKDQMSINFINPNILSCLFIENEARKAVYSACYQLINEKKDSVSGMYVILSLSTALEIELKSTLFKNFIKEINEYIDYNKITLGNMMYFISSQVQNYLTKESYNLKTPNSQLKGKILRYMNCYESEIEAIANIIHTILPIRNQVAHGIKVTKRELNIFLEFTKMIILILTKMRLNMITGGKAEMTIGINRENENDLYDFYVTHWF